MLERLCDMTKKKAVEQAEENVAPEAVSTPSTPDPKEAQLRNLRNGKGALKEIRTLLLTCHFPGSKATRVALGINYVDALIDQHEKMIVETRKD